jgi:hypothetical protein
VRYCNSEECSGLDPCQACGDIRRGIINLALAAIGLSFDNPEPEKKETLGKFYRAYGEAFETVLIERRKLMEAAAQQRVEEKEARDKSGSKEKEGREKPKGPALARITPKRVAVQRAATDDGELKNGHAAKKDPEVKGTEGMEHSHTKEQ